MMVCTCTLDFLELKVRYVAVTLSLYLLPVNDTLDLVPLKVHGHHHLCNLRVPVGSL